MCVVVPLATKRSAVDKHMELEKFREELTVVQQEMIRLMGYYTKNKLPSLKRSREELQTLLRGKSLVMGLICPIVSL